MIISRTPHRISFFGGGTDYPGYYLQHGGRVLGVAVDKYCYLSVRKLPPFFSHRHRIVYSRIENVDTPDEVQHPAVREVLRFMNIDYGVSIHHDGDIPARSGMGSSSAFTAGLLKSLHALEGRMISRAELARETIHVEQDLIRENVGSQDQTLAAYGGLNVVDFLQNGEIAVAPVVVPHERLMEFESHFLLFFSGISRIASEVAAEQIRSIPNNVDRLHAMKGLVNDGLSILTDHKRSVDEFGELLHQTWVMKKSLSQNISSGIIDDIYERSRAAGVIGGKLLGAGGGGFVLLFARPQDHAAIKAALADYLHIPFGFDFEGSNIIVYRP